MTGAIATNPVDEVSLSVTAAPADTYVTIIAPGAGDPQLDDLNNAIIGGLNE
jgi:hypothetical protein